MFLNQPLKCLENKLLPEAEKTLRECMSFKKIVYTELEEKEVQNLETDSKRLVEFYRYVQTTIKESILYNIGNCTAWESVTVERQKKFGVYPFHNQGLKLPYNPCAIALTISNTQIVVFLRQAEGAICFNYAVKTENEWHFPRFTRHHLLTGTVADYQVGTKLLEGQPVLASESVCFNNFITTWEMDQKEVKEYGSIFVLVDHISGTVIRFLTCKNSASEYVYKTRDQKEFNKIPVENRNLYRYKILKVMVPTSKKIYVYDKKIPPMEKMPVHLIGGRWRTYSGERKLFGKWTGCWWWQPYLRGNAKNGFITKDYDVKPAVS